MDGSITRESLRDYLDSVIAYWRWIRDHPSPDIPAETATHYIDAYQSVRVSMLGELKRKEIAGELPRSDGDRKLPSLFNGNLS